MCPRMQKSWELGLGVHKHPPLDGPQRGAGHLLISQGRMCSSPALLLQPDLHSLLHPTTSSPSCSKVAPSPGAQEAELPKFSSMFSLQPLLHSPGNPLSYAAQQLQNLSTVAMSNASTQVQDARAFACLSWVSLIPSLLLPHLFYHPALKGSS